MTDHGGLMSREKHMKNEEPNQQDPEPLENIADEIRKPCNQIEIVKRLSAYSAWLRGEVD
jgi:hypothetical protein